MKSFASLRVHSRFFHLLHFVKRATKSLNFVRMVGKVKTPAPLFTSYYWWKQHGKTHKGFVGNSPSGGVG
jgi:hypothetical protein